MVSMLGNSWSGTSIDLALLLLPVRPIQYCFPIVASGAVIGLIIPLLLVNSAIDSSQNIVRACRYMLYWLWTWSPVGCGAIRLASRLKASILDFFSVSGLWFYLFFSNSNSYRSLVNTLLLDLSILSMPSALSIDPSLDVATRSSVSLSSSMMRLLSFCFFYRLTLLSLLPPIQPSVLLVVLIRLRRLPLPMALL